jgi:hypothetical protein
VAATVSQKGSGSPSGGATPGSGSATGGGAGGESRLRGYAMDSGGEQAELKETLNA